MRSKWRGDLYVAAVLAFWLWFELNSEFGVALAVAEASTRGGRATGGSGQSPAVANAADSMLCDVGR